MTTDERNPGRWWALAALVLSTLAVGLDTTVLSVALPTLSLDLHASTGQLQWFIDSYTLVLAALVLPAGLLGDRFGRKRLLIAALVLFGVASAWCAYAGSANELIAARILLGIGAAFLLTLPASILPVLFGPDERTRAVTIWTTASFASLPLGPIVGGLLLDNFWWGSVFLINVPVVLIAIFVVATRLPESSSPHRVRFEPVGLSLVIAGVVALTYGVIEGGDRGWSDGLVWTALIAAAVLITGFIGWQRRIQAKAASGEQLLIDLSIFRSPGFTWGIALAVAATFAMFGVLFTGPQYFQSVLGYDVLGTGLRQLPMIGGLMVGGRLATLVVARSGAKAAVGSGFAMIAAGLALGATTSFGDGFGFAAIWMSIFGIGLGLTLPTSMDAAIGAIPADRAGLGSGLLMSLRMAASAIGVAVLGSVVNSGYRGKLDVHTLSPDAAAAVRDGVSTGTRTARSLGSPELLESVQRAFIHGMDVMLFTGVGIAILGLVLGVLFLPDRSSHGLVDAETSDSGESGHDVVRTS
jgi:DHA2 family multidrug resistance protein-like MFS transporter